MQQPEYRDRIPSVHQYLQDHGRKPVSRWDRFGMRIAHEVSTQSKDPSTKVGCYIADELHEPVSFGFNGFPRGIKDDERLDDRATKYRMVIHAEANAILKAHGRLDGCTAFIYPFRPCSQCAAFLIQMGIERVVAPAFEKEQWSADFEIADGLFREAHVDMLLLTDAEMQSIFPELTTA